MATPELNTAKELTIPDSAAQAQAFSSAVAARQGAFTPILSAERGALGALGQSAQKFAVTLSARPAISLLRFQPGWVESLVTRYRLSPWSAATPYLRYLRWLQKEQPEDASLPASYARPTARTSQRTALPVRQTAAADSVARAEPSERIVWRDRTVNVSGPSLLQIVERRFFTPQSLYSAQPPPLILHLHLSISRIEPARWTAPENMRFAAPEKLAATVASRTQSLGPHLGAAIQFRVPAPLPMPLSYPPVPIASWLGEAASAPEVAYLEHVAAYTRAQFSPAASHILVLPKISAAPVSQLAFASPADAAFAAVPRMAPGETRRATVAALVQTQAAFRSALSQPARPTLERRALPSGPGMPDIPPPAAGQVRAESPAEKADEHPAITRSVLQAAQSALDFAVRLFIETRQQASLIKSTRSQIAKESPWSDGHFGIWRTSALMALPRIRRASKPGDYVAARAQIDETAGTVHSSVGMPLASRNIASAVAGVPESRNLSQQIADRATAIAPLARRPAYKAPPLQHAAHIYDESLTASSQPEPIYLASAERPSQVARIALRPRFSDAWSLPGLLMPLPRLLSKRRQIERSPSDIADTVSAQAPKASLPSFEHAAAARPPAFSHEGEVGPIPSQLHAIVQLPVLARSNSVAAFASMLPNLAELAEQNSDALSAIEILQTSQPFSATPGARPARLSRGLRQVVISPIARQISSRTQSILPVLSIARMFFARSRTPAEPALAQLPSAKSAASAPSVLPQITQAPTIAPVYPYQIDRQAGVLSYSESSPRGRTLAPPHRSSIFRIAAPLLRLVQLGDWRKSLDGLGDVGNFGAITSDTPRSDFRRHGAAAFSEAPSASVVASERPKRNMGSNREIAATWSALLPLIAVAENAAQFIASLSHTPFFAKISRGEITKLPAGFDSIFWAEGNAQGHQQSPIRTFFTRLPALFQRLAASRPPSPDRETRSTQRTHSARKSLGEQSAFMGDSLVPSILSSSMVAFRQTEAHSARFFTVLGRPRPSIPSRRTRLVSHTAPHVDRTYSDIVPRSYDKGLHLAAPFRTSAPMRRAAGQHLDLAALNEMYADAAAEEVESAFESRLLTPLREFLTSLLARFKPLPEDSAEVAADRPQLAREFASLLQAFPRRDLDLHEEQIALAEGLVPAIPESMRSVGRERRQRRANATISAFWRPAVRPNHAPRRSADMPGSAQPAASGEMPAFTSIRRAGSINLTQPMRQIIDAPVSRQSLDRLISESTLLSIQNKALPRRLSGRAEYASEIADSESTWEDSPQFRHDDRSPISYRSLSKPVSGNRGSVLLERAPHMPLPTRTQAAMPAAVAEHDPFMIQRAVTGAEALEPPSHHDLDGHGDANQGLQADGGSGRGNVQALATEVWSMLRRRIANEIMRSGNR